jgi:hypothetical protein
MNWKDEEDELDNEWRDEDEAEEEAPSGKGRALSRLHPVAAVVLLLLVALFLGSLLFRMVMALRSAWG